MMTTPIVAIRGWHFSDSDHLMSLSVVREGDWDGPITYSDLTPSKYSHSGLWCVKPHYAYWLLGTYRPSAIGIVELPGLTVETEHGYLGSICIIRELFVISSTASVCPCPSCRQRGRKVDIKGLEERYQCPIHIGNIPSGSQWKKLVRLYRQQNAILTLGGVA